MATPSKPIILKITDAGKRGALNTTGDAVNLSVNLTHVAIGSGRYTPTGKETKIKTLIAKIATASGEVDASNTLQFSATIYADKITPVYELGLLSEDGTLFAIAAAINEPLFTIYPNVTFVVAFGLALNEASADKVTVTISPNASLMPAIMQNHLAAPNPHPQYLGLEHLDITKDPHPQYLDFKRFQLLLDVLIPMGYLHHTHSAANPKPDFDRLLGVETAWRRLTGKIIVATDPADPFIKDVGLTIGQKGMTSDAEANRPHTYPLYTTNVFERYNPDDVIETVWQVSANKTAIDEGAAIRFTLTASNVPDGQILKWTVKEGALNSASNDVTAPDATKSGSVILKNGSAIIDYTTTPDDNIAEAQKHVRLTVAAPANLSMNVPIMDVGRNETVVHISSSTNNGIVLDEYFKQHSGAYPVATDKVRFIVDAGVTIIAPNTSTPAIQEGTRWPAGSQMIVENRGRILGRGGDGGRSARVKTDYNSTGVAIPSDLVTILPAEKGCNGGTAIKGSNKLSIDNYGLIASGGGGGGGLGAYDNGWDAMNMPRSLPIGGGGTGGGAPLGKSSPNEATFKAYAMIEPYLNKITTLPSAANGSARLAVKTLEQGGVTTSGADGKFVYAYPAQYAALDPNDAKLFYFAFATENKINEKNLDFVLSANGSWQYQQSDYRDYYSGGSTPQLVRRMSTDATLDNFGLGGAQFNLTHNGSGALGTIFADSARGGDGGAIGEDGQAGAFKYYIVNDKKVSASEIRWEIPSADGGKAGFVKEGTAVINNFTGGVTKGR